jgi:hypothetical protein
MVYASLAYPVESIVFDVEANAMIQQMTTEFNYFALLNGGLSLFAIAYLLEDCYYQPADFGNCTNQLFGMVTDKINNFLADVVQLIFSKKVRKKIILFADNVLPVDVKSVFDKGLSNEELLDLTKRSLFIVCRSRGGKTTFLKYYLYTLIRSNQNLQLSICDINYGKPSDEGIINDWMGISADRIHSRDNTIFSAITAYSRELKTRKHECEQAIRKGIKSNPIKNKPINLLVIEELIATRIALMDADLWDESLKMITDGLVYGLGYGCPIVAVSQHLAVSQTDINLAMRDQFNIVALGKSASNPEVIKDCGFDDPDAIKSKVITLNKQNKRPILIAGVNESTCSTLPDLRWIDEVEIKITEPLDINQQWWEEIYVNNESNQQWLIDRVQNYLDGSEKSITSSDRVNDLMVVFGIKPNRQDKKYVEYFRPELDRLIEELKKG